MSRDLVQLPCVPAALRDATGERLRGSTARVHALALDAIARPHLPFEEQRQLYEGCQAPTDVGPFLAAAHCFARVHPSLTPVIREGELIVGARLRATEGPAHGWLPDGSASYIDGFARNAPPQYREMRRIAYGGAGYPADGVIFLRQGKFMADFEDDSDYDGEFFKYYPTYQDMNDRQLRGYFSWRTRLRRGCLTATSLSFAFVYLYELINQIGVSTPAAGFRTFRDFWLRYREIDPGIDRYCRLWLKDYVVYYQLDRSLLDDLPGIQTDREILILQNPQAHSADELFSALDAMSSYKLTESRFFKLHPDGVKTVVGNVYAALADRYHRDGQGGICEKLFGKLHSASYRIDRKSVV